MKKMKNKKGITLIALVVTIVIILILAGITVGMVTSDNGILKETKNAKEQAEIDNEKSIVERAKMLTMMRDKSGKITLEVFESALKDEAGTNLAEVSDAGDAIEVLFTDSNRYYEVDKDGNVSEPQEVVKDEYAGDITKGGRCDGSEEKPYEISCIEDLVAFSNMSNGTGITLENGVAVNVKNANTFAGKYVVLTRDLNFKSKYSYDNYARTDFGNLNNDDADGNELITEMTTGTGFISIATYPSVFLGNFNGKKHTIYNIYINYTEGAQALFGIMGKDSSIKNLTITGEIKSEKWHAAGFVAGTAGGGIFVTISNCINKADITGYNMVGGIATNYIKNIDNCQNYGTIEITDAAYQYSGAGGIVGVANNSNDEGGVVINNCKNYGEIKGTKCLGGIAGTSTGNTIIKNCVNYGTINNSITQITAGGILGWQRGGTLKILNSSNKESIYGKGNYGGIIGAVAGAGWDAILNTFINNCYNIGKIKTDGVAGGIVGTQDTVAAQNYLYISNSYNAGDVKGKESGNVLGHIYNSTRTDTKTEFANVYYTLEPSIGTGSLTSGEATLKSESEIKSQTFVDLLNSNIGTNTDWKKWKLGSSGYPTFVD